MIVDDDENYRLTFNIDGIILLIKLSEVQMSPPQARDMFIEIVNTTLPITHPGRTINRLGLVETYDFPFDAPGQIAANALTLLTDIGRPVDFTFRGAFRRGLAGDDWWNTILQVAATKSDPSVESLNVLRVSIDCQHYFSPDIVFVAQQVRRHYEDFAEAAESLQEGQLAGLAAAPMPVNG